MSSVRRHIDIDDLPDVARLASEVRDMHEPIVLRIAGADVAIVEPLDVDSEDHEPQEKPAEVRGELDGIAGAWSDLDTDAIVERIYSRRESKDRPGIDW